MARLPNIGGDDNNWGSILNDYLTQSHATDGTLKPGTIGAPQLKQNSVTNVAIASGAVTAAAISDGSIPSSKLSDLDQVVAASLPVNIPALVATEVTTQVDPKVAAVQTAKTAAETAATNATAAKTAAESARDAALGASTTSDSITAGLISTQGSATATVLNATYQPQDAIDAVLAKLDMRNPAGLVIAQASDSTGDAANEWFELAWQESFASLWKERPARVCRWYDPGTGGSYQPWEAWQTGDQPGSTVTGTIFKDSFPVDKTVLLNTSPEVGAPYTQYAANLPSWIVTGGKLQRTGSDDGTRMTLRGDFNPRTGNDVILTGTVKTSIATGKETEIMIVSDTEAIARVGLTVRQGGTVDLVKYFTSTATTLGTFPVGTFAANTEATFELSISGTTLTGKFGAETLTATLTSGEVSTLATTTRLVLRSQIVGCQFDNLLATGTITTAPIAATLPRVDVYNGGAAGKTPDYQRANLAAMYPVRPDILFINHGHNCSPTNGWTLESFFASVQGLVDDLNTRFPEASIPIAVISQNPEFGSGVEAAHFEKMIALRAYAEKKGWGYIPTYEAFSARADGGQCYLQDPVHPAIGTGRRLQADTAKAWIKGRSKRP